MYFSTNMLGATYWAVTSPWQEEQKFLNLKFNTKWSRTIKYCVRQPKSLKMYVRNSVKSPFWTASRPQNAPFKMARRTKKPRKENFFKTPTMSVFNCHFISKIWKKLSVFIYWLYLSKISKLITQNGKGKDVDGVIKVDVWLDAFDQYI